jgi:hypothetical protein
MPRLLMGWIKIGGDLNESLLAAAVNYITSGSARLSTTKAYPENVEVKNGNSVLSQPSFKGAVDPRRIMH